ncbi:hypothetical protein TPHA_0I02950 [Tetrapisispora phaffii CBS 4417]|uniref:Yippee domain-containing protein n=1 Tax=Tetrapisispora phaffii (strain ATCC 24235 / CBS 4417 / NBRC 1672 / NRRL Y-8282 / UCD 70-5) TaxID=1071381 RepID=G8BY18_TETPH|nr:hypothetical protein TPHA_0I02950 [Tetrapisispora phaffii CBS 4417]CCE64796.1 hypothetical protein TPHA_0I02950 [Tetrapisispora phaffii CBS 4417]
MGLRYSSYIDPVVPTEGKHLAEDISFQILDYRLANENGSRSWFTPRTISSRLRRVSSSSASSTSHYKVSKNFVTYGCRTCRTHLSSYSQIMSKDYRGKTGDAYLMHNVVNVVEGEPEVRSMITGDYIVCDILCHWCKNVVGWKYLESEKKEQRYKEGTYVLELQTICKCD